MNIHVVNTPSCTRFAASSCALLLLPMLVLAQNTSPPAGVLVPAAATLSDAEFVSRAVQGGRAEIFAARDVANTDASVEVKMLAETLVKEHSALNVSLEKLAQHNGWLMPADVVVTDTARKTTGTAQQADRTVDAQFLAEQIAAHEKSLVMYREHGLTVVDAELEKIIQEALPILERHLTELRRLKH
jgi:putative membrane protein